jgi:hypothetical protein
LHTGPVLTEELRRVDGEDAVEGWNAPAHPRLVKLSFGEPAYKPQAQKSEF